MDVWESGDATDAVGERVAVVLASTTTGANGVDTQGVSDVLAPKGLEELEALALLCSALARLFTYPTYDQAVMFTNEESADYLDRLMHDAGADGIAAENAVRPVVDQDEHCRAQRLRIDETQLLFVSNAPVPLEGSRWIRRNPTGSQAVTGEAASVMRCYRESGLSLREGCTMRADALPVELDYVAYLLRREARFRNEGKGAQALLWKRRRTSFVAAHLDPLAKAVASGVSRHNPCAHLVWWSQLLQQAVIRCAV
ncbi:molecular chaperone TorD family protein [Adlercreutzia sp. ZJ138]|uniref:molecular chaperone TorD family protein n=1 Tax=Adlercreutzia sp. ZJ138 TaxID=2709405 RepID=UPI0013EC0108|nr:molecular chaperone TorD family protein [Adlercreutzia sp. ZJ138]